MAGNVAQDYSIPGLNPQDKRRGTGVWLSGRAVASQA